MYMRTLACYVLTSFVKVRQALPKLVRTGYESIPYDVRPGKVLWLVTVVRPLDLNVKHQLGNLWATPTFSNLDIVLTLCFSSVYFSVPFSFSVMHSMSVAIYQIIDRIFVMIKKRVIFCSKHCLICNCSKNDICQLSHILFLEIWWGLLKLFTKTAAFKSHFYT